MRIIGWLSVVVVFCCATQTAPAQVEIVHRPEYKAGEVIRTVSEAKFSQKLVLSGANIDTAVESYSATRETVGDATPDGKTPLQGEFEYFIVSIATPVGKYSFDSGNPDKENAVPGLESLDDLFRATSKARWVSLLTDKPEVESVEFIGKPFEKLESPFSSEVTPERFRREANMLFARLPDGPVSVGDKWQRTEVHSIGSGQELRFEKEFEYLGAETSGGATLDRIGVRSLTVDYAIGDGSTLPLKLDSSDLKVDSSKGAMLVNRTVRSIVSATETARLTGKLNFTFDLNGKPQKLPGELDLTMEVKSTSERQAGTR